MAITNASIGKIYNYALQNQGFGTIKEQAVQNDEALKFTTEGGKLAIDADGNGTSDWEIDLSKLTRAQLEAMGIPANEINEILGTQNSEGTEGTDSTKSRKQAQLDEKMRIREENLKKMGKIEDDIEDLIDSIEKKTQDAVNERIAIQEEQQTEINNRIRVEVEKYVSENKKTSGSMTHEDLQSNIQVAIADVAGESAAQIAGLAMAQNEIGLLDGKVSQLRGLIDDTKALEGEIRELEGSLNTPEPEVPKAEEPSDKPKTENEMGEPQGFQIEEDGQMVQYDFFIEKDGKAGLSSKEELMGYTEGKKGKTDEEIQEKGWSEMTRLNENGDDVIDFGELTSQHSKDVSGGEVMVLKSVKNEDGTITQKAMTIEEAFGENSRYGGNISINANQEEGVQDGVGPFEFGAEGFNNKMLGNFKVNLGTGDNAQEVMGYQTLDDEAWLDQMFFNGNSGAGVGAGTKVDFANGKTSSASILGDEFNGMSEELRAHLERIEAVGGYVDQIDDLKANAKNAWITFGCTAINNQMADLFALTADEGIRKVADEEYYETYMNENVRQDDNRNKKPQEV